MGYPDATQGTTHFNAITAQSIEGSTVTGSSIDFAGVEVATIEGTAGTFGNITATNSAVLAQANVAGTVTGTRGDFTTLGGKALNGSTVTGSEATIPQLTGSAQTGSTATITTVNASTITGSALTLAAGSLGGMIEIVTGTTGAAGATKSLSHNLAATPSWVGLTAYSQGDGSATISLAEKGTAEILVESWMGSVAVEAILFK